MAFDAGDHDLSWADDIVRSFEPYDFEVFHRSQLPVLVEQRGHLVAADLADAAPLAFRCDGRAFTWVPSSEGVEVREGDDDAGTVVEVTEDGFSEFLHELLTAWGLERTERASFARGDLAGLQRWEPAIHSLCSGLPVYGPEVRETLVDSAGEPLDLHRAFTVNDDREEMRHFFEAAGYLVVKAVFTSDEVSRFGAEVEEARRRTTIEDPLSWWSVTEDGRNVVSRINYLGRHSSVLADLAHDPRLQRFADVAGRDLRVCDDRLDGPMVFIKNNIAEGRGNLNWHIDPTLGGAPVICPYIQLGIQLDHANAANGQLLVLAGSHRYHKHELAWGEEGDLPVVAIDTEPGDLTIHDGFAMHTTPPPSGAGAGRRALYYKFAEPKTFTWVPAGYHYFDGLFRNRSVLRAAIGAVQGDTRSAS